MITSTSCICLNPKTFTRKFNREEVIIDPIQISCCKIIPDEPIKSFKSSTEYEGRIIIKASIDTMNLVFNNYQVVFAELQSKINPNDTIEFRMEDKIGNFIFVENLKPELIKHLNYLKIIRTNEQKCLWSDFYFPIKIE